MDAKNHSTNANGKRRKVYYKHARQRNRPWVKHPVIRLDGKFLQDFGFNVGDEIEVSYEQDRIVICRLPQ